ncbi:acyltransferase family protein [Leucobacter japonicus]|uniref:acyltransferase family protein n=1 Tax=Leucobacter japonicus TaxID=1461259 RepID=UPI0006A7C5D8|nr:acyltransferase [Leucobacter japonicus]
MTALAPTAAPTRAADGQPSVDAPTKRLDIDYLDGIRAVLALLVVLSHVTRITGPRGFFEDYAPYFARTLNAVDFRVPAFIALSGFSLMLAVAQRDDLRIRGGAAKFLKRRFRRLVPPYLAALVVTLALIAFVPVMSTPMGTSWDDKIPATVQSIVAHVFLIHNFSPDWLYSINGAMWSVSIEVQLILLMPLILVPWRRIPPTLVIIGLFGIAGAMFVFGIGGWSSPHYLGVFGIGMYAAYLTVGTPEQLQRRRPRIVRWFLEHSKTSVTILGVIMLAYTLVSVIAPGAVPTAAGGSIAGVAAAVFMMLLCDGQRTGAAGTRSARRLLSRPKLVLLGNVCYSIFLLHSPLLALANLLLLPLGLHPLVYFLIMALLVAPVVVVVCILFAAVVERPFMSDHQQRMLARLMPRRRAKHQGVPALRESS